jgi:hypothetical protein
MVAEDKLRELVAILELGDRAGVGAFIPQYLVEALLQALRLLDLSSDIQFGVVVAADDQSPEEFLGSSPNTAIATAMFEKAKAIRPGRLVQLKHGARILRSSQQK